MHTSQRKSGLTATVWLLLALLPAPGITHLFSPLVTTSAGGSGVKAGAINQAPTGAPDEAGQTRVAEAYGRLPLSFEINRGQADARVKFLARGGGYSLFLTATEAVLSLTSLWRERPAQSFRRHLRPRTEMAGRGTPGAGARGGTCCG